MNCIYTYLLKFFLKTLNSCRIITRNVFIFESYPEFDGSPWMIYQELVKLGYKKKYKFVWAIDSSLNNIPSGIKSVPFFGHLSFKQRIERLYYLASAKLIIDSNRPIYKINPYTIRIFTRHGGPLKKCTEYMHSLGEMDYLLTLSKELQMIDYLECKGFCIKNIENILTLGFPANDRLFRQNNLLCEKFFKSQNLSHQALPFAKIIGWLPTFRQHRGDNIVDSERKFPFGIPLIQNLQELTYLNIFLKTKNILLVIQIHHAQREDFLKKKFSNIIFISQDFKYKMGVVTADLMRNFDALITDYSAAYHEYILLNRPIALSIDDFEEYSSKTGFYFDYFDWIKGVYLRNVSDLKVFIEDVVNGVDSAKSEREKALHRIHKYIDNQSTKRVVDFLIEKAKL